MGLIGTLDMGQALIDCGLARKERQRFTELSDAETRKRIHLLRENKKRLLTDLHKTERRIDCTDFVISYLEKG